MIAGGLLLPCFVSFYQFAAIFTDLSQGFSCKIIMSAKVEDSNSSYVDVFSMIKRFQQLQEERVHVYHLFNEGHKIYLGTAPQYEFIRFRQLVHKVTQEFKRISEDIISIEQRLRREVGRGHLADYIASIQEGEKHKLELTAQLQLAKQGVIDHPDEPEREIHVIELKQRLNEVIERINQSLVELRCETAEL